MLFEDEGARVAAHKYFSARRDAVHFANLEAVAAVNQREPMDVLTD
jgi:hypothetical protein